MRMRKHYRHKSRRKWCRTLKAFYRKTGALNSNMTSDFKPEVVMWLKLRMRNEKAQKGEKQRRTAIPSDIENRCR